MNDAPPKKKRTWLWIVLGIFFLFVVVAIGGIIFSVAFVRQSMTVTGMSEGDADKEFEAVRAKFAGRQPLIQMIDGQAQYVGDSATTTPSTVPLKSMHVMAWDDEEGQLVTFSLPFWLLRLKSGPIRLSAYSQGWDDRGVSFRVEDLERHGPGLLLDVYERREGRVIIWAE
jgi:hypothetical protein